MKPGKPLTRSSPLERKRELKRNVTPLKRTSPPKRSLGISPASKAQRAKVRDAACVVCGRDRSEARIDAAHLWPRGRGGGDCPLCVVPLCAEHHGSFDDGALSLLEHLEPRYRAEVAHAVEHGGLIAVLQRLTGERWAPEQARTSSQRGEGATTYG